MTSIGNNGVVEFEFFRRGVPDVQLVGDFTDWDDRPLAMQSVGDGWWKASASLPCGEYRFHYRAGGESFADYAAYGVEMTESGTHSVLRVPKHEANRPGSATLAA